MKAIFFTFFVLILTVSSYAENFNKKLIVILRYRIEKNYFSNTVKSFIKALNDNGFNKNNLKIIDYLTSTADLKSVPEVNKIVNQYKNKADLFVTCGWISIYARKILKETDIPQIFLPVLKSVALKLISSVKYPPHTNINGVYLQYPPEKIIRIAKLILPEIKRYAYIYDSRIPADTTFKQAYSKVKTDIKIYFFDLKEGVDKVLQNIKIDKIEAIGGIVGMYKHLKDFDKLNIPIITSFTLDIEEKDLKRVLENHNFIAGLFNPFSYCGYQAGLMAVKVLNGKYIGDIKPIPAKQIAFINLKAADKLNIKIPFKAIDAVDIIVK